MIQIGVITCPRRVSYLGRTLRSLLAAGVEAHQVRVFSDTVEPPPEPAALGIECVCQTPEAAKLAETIRLEGHRDGTPNWMRALEWSTQSGDYVCTCEDDIEFAPQFLEHLVSAGNRIKHHQRSDAWVIVPHFTEPGSHFELLDDSERYDLPGVHCILRWSGEGTERGRYDAIGIGTQLCFMDQASALLVRDLYRRAYAGEFEALKSIAPRHWAMDVGLMKFAHRLNAIDLCVVVPCLVQHIGEVCAHTEGRDAYPPDDHRNRYFDHTSRGRDAASDRKPRNWQGAPQ